MEQNISQEEIRRIIISDMVKKRNSIVPVQTGRNSNLKTTQGYWINKDSQALTIQYSVRGKGNKSND